MAKPLEIIDLGETNLMIPTKNGIKHVKATRRCKVYFDEYFKLDWDFEPGEKEKLQDRIERGDIMPAFLIVEFECEGFTGTDSLGGVLVSKPEDIQDTVNEHDMANNAAKDCLKQIEDCYSRLKNIFE